MTYSWASLPASFQGTLALSRNRGKYQESCYRLHSPHSVEPHPVEPQKLTVLCSSCKLCWTVQMQDKIFHQYYKTHCLLLYPMPWYAADFELAPQLFISLKTHSSWPGKLFFPLIYPFRSSGVVREWCQNCYCVLKICFQKMAWATQFLDIEEIISSPGASWVKSETGSWMQRVGRWWL